MNIITLNRVLLNNIPLNYRRKRILTEKDFYFKTIERTFTFSKSAGGKSIKDGRAYIKRIKGNSVVWNNIGYKGELVGDIAQTLPEGAHIVQGHKYLFRGTLQDVGLYLYTKRIGASSEIVASLRSSDGDHIFIAEMSAESNGLANTEGGLWWYQYTASNGKSEDVQLIDLTQMFGAGNEPSTIEEYNARKPIVEDEYAYNEGQVIHCNTESIKSIGDNALDEEWESGRYEPSTGLPNLEEGIRSKNRIKVLPNEVYWCSAQNDLFAHFYDAEGNLITTVYGGQYNYLPIKNKQFTTPTNAATMTIYVVGTTTYNHDIMITLVHSGWKQDTDAGYQPYWQDILPLPIIRKYFPDGMKSAGSAHDEIRFNKVSGKWEAVQRIGSVDSGTFDYILDSRFDNAQFYCDTSLINNNIRCGRYVTIEGGWDTNKDKTITRTIGSHILIVDSAYTDAASFKAAMAGVMLYYELAEPIVTEITEDFRDYYNVADFGTEQSQSNVPSAALLADVGYYFKKSEVKELTLN